MSQELAQMSPSSSTMTAHTQKECLFLIEAVSRQTRSTEEFEMVFKFFHKVSIHSDLDQDCHS
jgi:hypothetical protein